MAAGSLLEVLAGGKTTDWWPHTNCRLMPGRAHTALQLSGSCDLAALWGLQTSLSPLTGQLLVALQGLEVKVWRDYEEFLEELSSKFPHEKEGIRNFYDECWRVFNSLNSLELKSLEEPRYLLGGRLSAALLGASGPWWIAEAIR